MATVINGTAVVFGFQSTTNGITITGVTGLLLQSKNSTRQSDKEMVRNAIGDRVSEIYYDQNDTVTLETVQTGSGLAAAITNYVYQNPGAIIVISACAADPELIQTNWIVDSCTKAQSNTSAAKLTLTLHRAAGITAVASA